MMICKAILNLVCLLVCTVQAVAQNTTAYQHDTAKVMQWIAQAQRYRFTKPDSFLPVANKALHLAQSLKFSKGEGNALMAIGEFHRVSGNFPEALQYLFASLRISRQINDSAMEGGSLTFIGNAYIGLEEFRMALNYLFQGYEINRGRLEINNTAFGLTNIGVAYQQLNMLDSALVYQKKAWQVGKKMPMKPGIAFMLRETGVVYALRHQYDTALYYYRNALASSNDVLNIGRTYTRMSMLYDEMNNPDSVVFYARLALSHGQISLQKAIVLDASKLLAKYFLEKYQPDSVIKYQGLNMALQDSLFGRRQLRKLQLLAIEEQKRIHASQQKQQQIEQEQTNYRNRIRLYSLLAASIVLLVLGLILFRNNRQKQKANRLLQETLSNLKAAQSNLIQSEKMASLGQLTAGIAHEIQNPLNFVNNFSEVSNELIDEMKGELAIGNMQQANEIADDIKQNLEKINHHGKRADAIVKGMLQHSRISSGQKESTDINVLCDEYLRLAYNGMRAKNKSFNAALETDYDSTIEKIEIIPQDIGRVILNLITNAFYAVNEKFKTQRSNATNDSSPYVPTVAIVTKKLTDKPDSHRVEIKIEDNGNGIPQNIVDKIFQPFFTTKPTGQGTGLGLSLSYDIVTAHGGELKVETKEGQGSAFIISLPRK